MNAIPIPTETWLRCLPRRLGHTGSSISGSKNYSGREEWGVAAVGIILGGRLAAFREHGDVWALDRDGRYHFGFRISDFGLRIADCGLGLTLQARWRIGDTVLSESKQSEIHDPQASAARRFASVLPEGRGGPAWGSCRGPVTS